MSSEAVGSKRKARDSAPFDPPRQPHALGSGSGSGSAERFGSGSGSGSGSASGTGSGSGSGSGSERSNSEASAPPGQALRDVKEELAPVAAAAGGATAAAAAAPAPARKITFDVLSGDGRRPASSDKLELALHPKHTLFDVVSLLCEHYIHDDVYAHMWIVEHLGRRYIGPFGAEMVDEPSDVGVSHNEGPLLSALNLQVGAEMHLRYDMGSTTHVRLVCKGVGAAEAGEALPSAKWRGGSAAAVPEPAQDWAREMYPAVFAFLMQDGGILDVGLGNSFDKICELTACNCGGNLELDQHVSEAPDGLAQALGRLDAELRTCDILSQDFYAQLPAAKQTPWPKHFPRVTKFISKRPQGKQGVYLHSRFFLS